MAQEIISNLALSEDEAKLLSDILNQLHFAPKDAKSILIILDKLNALILQPDLKPQTIIILPEEAHVKITKK